MKSFFPLLLLAFALLVSACSGPIETIEFKSPEGDRSIVVTGERKVAGDPITVTMTLKVPGNSASFKFEHQASSLTKENCSATWNNNFRATVTFVMDDGEAWVVEAFLLDDKVEAVKRFKIDGKSIF